MVQHIITETFFNNQEYISCKNPFERRYNCPACGDTKYHLYYNRQKKVFKCFKCDISGKLNWDIPDVAQYGISMEGYKSSTRTERTDTTKENISSLPKKTLPLNEPIIDKTGTIYHEQAFYYLRDRGITIDQIRMHDIRVSLETKGPYKNCVIFHFGDPLEYFVCRRYTDEQPKYINAPWPKDGFYYSDQESSTLVVVEGIMDLLAVEQFGYSCVALLGKKANSKQLRKIAALNKKILVYLDEDALKQAIQLTLELQQLRCKVQLISNFRDASSELKHGALDVVLGMAEEKLHANL